LLEKIDQCLSKKELMVFEYCQKGLTTKEIAEEMDTSAKSIANTLNRIKTKIRKLL